MPPSTFSPEISSPDQGSGVLCGAMKKHLYIDNTGADTRDFHPIIAEAIRNGGQFDEDYSDVFKLTKLPEDAGCEWALDFAD